MQLKCTAFNIYFILFTVVSNFLPVVYVLILFFSILLFENWYTNIVNSVWDIGQCISTYQCHNIWQCIIRKFHFFLHLFQIKVCGRNFGCELIYIVGYVLFRNTSGVIRFSEGCQNTSWGKGQYYCYDVKLIYHSSMVSCFVMHATTRS